MKKLDNRPISNCLYDVYEKIKLATETADIEITTGGYNTNSKQRTIEFTLNIFSDKIFKLHTDYYKYSLFMQAVTKDGKRECCWNKVCYEYDVDDPDKFVEDFMIFIINYEECNNGNTDI